MAETTWKDITTSAFNGDYNAYIRYANQVLNISGMATAESTNGMRIFNIMENTHYKVGMLMQNRFRLGCVDALTSGITVTNYVFHPQDTNGTDNVGSYQELEITSKAGQTFLCVGAWSTGAGDTIFNTLNTIVLYETQPVVSSFTVTFLDNDGSILKIEDVPQGEDAIPPSTPIHEGYVFTGWDGDYHNVQAAITVTAQYKKLNIFNVTFKDWNGTVLKDEFVVEYGTAVAPDNPIRDGYDFAYWDKPFDNITADTIITAVYTPKVQHTVTFKDWDGAILKNQTVEHGASASAPAVEERTGYHFIGWDNDFTCIVADMSITAQYVQIIYYTVTFVDWDETSLKTESVESGTAATAPSNPTRSGYAFTGWNPSDFTNIMADLTVTAQYEQIIVYHRVSFYEDSTKAIFYGSFQVEDGRTAMTPLPPTKDGYVFDHWDKDLVSVTADTDVYAVFKQAPPKTVILIYAANGKLLQSIDKVMSSSLRDSLDGELTFDFSTLAAKGEAIDIGCVAEFQNNYYNIVRVSKKISSGVMIVSASCEHISYVLNDDQYQIEAFDFTGLPADGLNKLLAGTQFSTGTVEFTNSVTMKINQKATRRAALMQFIAILGGEIEYEGHFIHIRKHRGNSEVKDILKTRNVTDVGVTYESRAGTASYEIALGKGMDCMVGDEVKIVFSPLGINAETRIIAIEYNPFHLYNIKLDVGDYKPTINDSLYSMTESVDSNNEDMSAIWDEMDNINSDYSDIQTEYDNFLSTYREVKNISVAETQFSVFYTDDSSETYNYSTDTAGRMTSIRRVV